MSPALFRFSILTCCSILALGQNTGRRIAGQAGPPPPPRAQIADCPPPGAKPPPPVTPRSIDFVELQRSVCFGFCPAYSVRISADGRIVWHGEQYVQVTGEQTSQVRAADAAALIEKFRTDGLWTLCGSYTRAVTDVPTFITTVQIGDQSWGVSDRADGAPGWLRDLDREVDVLADTHQWIHGDPRAETFAGQLSADARGPKPGLTPLMQASAQGDVSEIDALLQAGADPNARDASGWTALMYATEAHAPKGETADAIRKLLAAGANPNQSSEQGETAVMATVTVFYQPAEKLRLLIAAGANVNAQNRQGQTALMYAVRQFDRADESVSVLLEAGARTDVRDNNGLTASDYLDREAARRKNQPRQVEKLRQLLTR